MKKRDQHKHSRENGHTIKRIVKKKNGVDFKKRYLKVKDLGKGAFGEVYSAFDQQTSKTVAIKCLIDNTAIDDFKDELTLLKRLKHPSIVPYLDSFVDSKKALHIVMEYAENGSLLDIVKTYGPLTETIASIYLLQVLEGLKYLHDQSIIHRDIKAANILMQGDNAKLADFGLAIDLDHYGHTLREAAGSPYWMAPEVINGEPTDTKSDIWSIGATAVELLTGTPPLWELPPMPAMFQIAGPRDMKIPQQFSPLCKDFLSQCLTKSPKMRPDVKQLLEHPWLEKARNIRRSNSSQCSNNSTLKPKGNNKYDMMSLTMRLGGEAFWSNDIVLNTPNPEEMCSMLIDDLTFEEGALNIMNNITKMRCLPKLIQGICGGRLFIDKLSQPQFRRQILNFIQCIAPYSENIVTTLLMFSVPQSLLFDTENRDEIDVIHQQITGIMLLFCSETSPKFCCYSGLVNKMDQLMSSPILSIFVPRLALMIFNTKLPGRSNTAVLAKKEFIKEYIELAFKAALHLEKYQKMIEEKFLPMSKLLDSGDKTNFNKPLISDFLITMCDNMLNDSISLLILLSKLSPQVQCYMAESFAPICFIINNQNKFAAFTPKHFSKLLFVINNITSNKEARDKINIEAISKSLISKVTGKDNGDSSVILQIISNTIKGNPELIESSCDKGLCYAIERSKNIIDSTVIIRDLLCEIPTISEFCIWKLKETDLYQILIDLLELPIWNRKAIHALSCWSQADSRFISKHLLSHINNIQDFMLSELQSSNIQTESFTDLSIIMKYCPEIGRKLYSDNVLKDVMSCLTKVGPLGQVQFFDFLIQLILQAPNPNQTAGSLLNQMIPYTQSSVIQVQKAALRIRILSRC